MAKASTEPRTPAAVKSSARPEAGRKRTKPVVVLATKKRQVEPVQPPPRRSPKGGKAAAAKPATGKTAPNKVIGKISAPQRAASKAVGTPRTNVAAKKSAKATSGKLASRPPAARTASPAPARRDGRKLVPKTSPVQEKTPQVFTVSHLNHDDFKADGLRPYARYRDLGIAAATGDLCQAHVIRLTPPCTDAVRKRHLHEADLQLIYVLQGWMKNEFEGHGEQMMSAGSCWLQPSGIKHTVLDYSPDCEVLEIIVPADFKTKDLT